MKTLKFMLAAATAIGLVSATQADQYNTTGFEKLTVGDSVTTGVQDNRSGYSYFYYAGATAEDNESVIAEGTPNIARPRGASAVDATRNNILQVSTGTDPLLRTYQGFTGSSPQAATTLASDVYVDTLVQFTVTPYTDTVTPSANDKLMIYLKESVTTNEMGEITSASTNLVVVGGFYNGDTTVAKEYGLNTGSVSVNPNEWHRLTVKAVVDLSGGDEYGFPGFQIWVDGELCTLADSAQTYDTENQDAADLFGGFALSEDIDAGKYVLSLLAGSGEQDASLQGVGFAGEGKVDDIVFSELDPFATVFDFTFAAWESSKVSAVTYTVGGVEYTQAGSYEVEAGTEVAITSITYGDAWLAGTIDAVNMSDPVSGVYTVTNAGASLTINPEVFFPRTQTADQDGTAAHPYEVADAAALQALQKGVLAGKDLTGVNFQMTGNIDMTGVTDFWGIGWFASSDSKDASITASGNVPFTGVFDGAGYTISNVTLVRHNYAGLFNNVSGTVKNLTVQNLGFSGTCSEWGCAIVGNAQGSALLENLTSAGSVWGDTANHNVAGTVVRAQNTVTIRGCVNNAPITANSRRLGGIISFTGNTTPTGTITIDSCTNNAALTIPSDASNANAGDRGVGGIISRPESIADGLVISNCANFGALTNGKVPAKVGGIAGELNSQNYVDGGGNTYLASLGPVGNYNSKTVTGLTYALPSTIGGQAYLTTVAAGDLAAGNTYTLLADVAASETPVFTLQADGDFIAFLLGSYTFAGTIAGAEGLTVTDATESGVTTFTAATSSSGADWVPDPETITPNTDAATQYTELAGTALATADAKELTEWAATNHVAFADVTTAMAGTTAEANVYVEAFLLNCEPTAAEVAEEKDEFVLDISVAADGTITVSLPEGKTYNGTVKLKGKAALTDAAWADVPNNTPSSTYKFYKYELSL